MNRSQYTTALYLERQGQFARALTLFKSCLEKKIAKDADLLFHCGWCLEQDETGSNQEALDFYLRASETATHSGLRMNSFFRAGWLLMHDNKYPEAAERFQTAMSFRGMRDASEEIFLHASFWYAVCLENLARFLEAIRCYEQVVRNSAALAPESHLRMIYCLNRVGKYREALRICRTFQESPPQDFDASRYQELRRLANQEAQMIEHCLSDPFLRAEER